MAIYSGLQVLMVHRNRVSHLYFTQMKFAFTDQNRVPYSIYNAFQEQGVNLKQVPIVQKMLGEGVNAEFLKLGANGWQKGKFRIKVIV